MKTLFYSLCLFGMGASLFQGCAKPNSNQIVANRKQSFDDGWKFIKDSISGAENPAFDDSNWRILDLPHDWSIEDLPGPQTDSQIGHFSKSSPGGFFTGYSIGGTAWYRKHFTLDEKDKGKLIKILFDGVMTESDVWINGKHLGYHPNGYTPFAYDLTPFINLDGKPNLIAVRVKNIGKTSRWYSGSGIYRHVGLILTDPIHIDLWGVHISTPEVSNKKATIIIATKVANESENDADITVEASLFSKDGKVSGQTSKSKKISPKANNELTQTIIMDNPELWSPDSPNMYNVVVNIKSNGNLVDSYTMKTGIRSIKYDAQHGLMVNDQSVKLKGANIHHDNGLLGAAAFDRAEERKIEILKANGFNAIRSSHNMPSSKFLDVCDSLGMLVMDEVFDTWTKPKTPDDYHIFFKEYWKQDLNTMLLRDRNHPSVIIWSIGNEIAERADPEGLEITKQLIDEVKKQDTSRPISEAICAFFAFMGQDHAWDYSAPAYSLLDIGGYNYTWDEWENDHNKYPGRLMMTTESMPVDMFAIWGRIDQSPWILGDFVWTGMDYLGESGVAHGKVDNEKIDYGMGIPGSDMGFCRAWPWFNAWCGDIDIIGSKKPQSYYRDVVWNRSQLEIAVHTPVPAGHQELVSAWGWPSELPCWTWPGEEGKTFQVSVYTRCTSVRLELNDKVIGEKMISADLKARNPNTLMAIMSGTVPEIQLAAKFDVPYAAGELKAIGLVDGKEVVTKVLKSARAPKKLILTPDRRTIRANRNDLAYVTIEVADENGNVIPNANVKVDFTIAGEGELAAAGNGSPDQMGSFRQPTCKTFRGKALIIVRPYTKAGKITLTAKSEGLASTTLNINVK